MVVSSGAGMAEAEPYAVPAEFLAELTRVLGLVQAEPMDHAIELLLAARAAGRRVYIVGNGGSAATASHLVCDLTKTTNVAGRQPLRAFALTDNVPLLTAWANDTDYGNVFAEQLAALLEPGDVVIAISASGDSPNVVAGLTTAAAHGAHTIGLLGFDGGRALHLVDVPLHVPCHDYGLIEATHLAIGQALVGAIRQAVRAETSERGTSARKRPRPRGQGNGVV
jgi:D-sedoheptulose 7-phosphate isomerase